jgi:hypothetical protein
VEPVRELLLIFRQLGRVFSAAQKRGTWAVLFTVIVFVVLGPVAIPIWLALKVPLLVLGIGGPVTLWVLDYRPAAIALAVGILVAIPVVHIIRDRDEAPAPPSG